MLLCLPFAKMPGCVCTKSNYCIRQSSSNWYTVCVSTNILKEEQPYHQTRTEILNNSAEPQIRFCFFPSNASILKLYFVQYLCMLTLLWLRLGKDRYRPMLI